MKILQVVQGYQPARGGTEWLVQRVSEELVRGHGDEVTVFTTNCYNGEGFWNPSRPRMATGVSEINGVRVERFAVRARLSQALRPLQKLFFSLGLPGHDWMRTWFGGPVIPGLRGKVAATEADVVSAASFPLLHMFDALAGARRSGRPAVLTGCIHPLDLWGFGRANILEAIRACDHYIALTEYEREYLAARGIAEGKISVAGVGVDPQPFEAADLRAARRELGVPEDGPVIGFIGQIGKHKGIDTLLKAMPAVWEAVPAAHLLIAGSRAQYGEQLDRVVYNWPLDYQKQTKLVFNFEEAQKANLFAATDIFAYPSGYESFGISYLEAWAAGKPVIGTWNGAIRTVVDSGRDGLLVKFGEAEALAEALITLLRNPGWAQEMGRAGRAKVHRSFTWQKVAARFREAFSAVIPA